MQTAFVTGITGQDGGYLAERLVGEGWQVHGLVHSPDHARAELMERTPEVVLHEGDLGDASRLSAVLDEVRPSEIYNLGGISSVALSWQAPVLTAAVNGLGAAGLLEAAWSLQERHGAQVRVAHASSAEIFGAPAVSPQDENTPIRPHTPYGASKAFAHHLVDVYRRRGLFATACILYNHESPRRPETFVTRKITLAAARIAHGAQQTLALGNLDARRDWGWAPDYVDGLIRAIRHDEAQDYVLATGISHSVRDFVEAAFTHAGIADWTQWVEVEAALTRLGDAVEQRGDATRAGAMLGWTPSASFADVVHRMVDADLARV
jgi:GDPmannose 4,6-dehydratase